jgi:hypothetical protein
LGYKWVKEVRVDSYKPPSRRKKEIKEGRRRGKERKGVNGRRANKNKERRHSRQYEAE